MGSGTGKSRADCEKGAQRGDHSVPACFAGFTRGTCKADAGCSSPIDKEPAKRCVEFAERLQSVDRQIWRTCRASQMQCAPAARTPVVFSRKTIWHSGTAA